MDIGHAYDHDVLHVGDNYQDPNTVNVYKYWQYIQFGD